MTEVCARIESGLTELFSCSESDGYVRVRTPYLYPDGDVIDLFVETHDDTLTVTDLGETLRWLRMQTITQRMSPRQRWLIEDVCLNSGVELFHGMLNVRVRADDDLAAAVTRLGQAAVRVADIWFTFRTRIGETVVDDVAEFLEQRNVPYERGEKLIGRSGRVWQVDFHTRHAARSALVNVLSTASRGAADHRIKHVITMWFDLTNVKLGPAAPRFISLLDDTIDVWTENDIRLLEDASEVTFWSRPDEFFERLAA